MFLSEMRRGEELKTEEPNHNAKPNEPVMMRRMKRMRHQGKEDKGKRPNPRTAMRMRKETTAV